MIHRGYRSLDEAPRLMGFTLGQWARLILLAGGVIGGVLGLGLPVKAAISVCAVLIGVPGALAYVSEPGGVRWGRLAVDAAQWRVRGHRLRGIEESDAAKSGASVERVVPHRPRTSDR